jgi:hypothetical protein
MRPETAIKNFVDLICGPPPERAPHTALIRGRRKRRRNGDREQRHFESESHGLARWLR